MRLRSQAALNAYAANPLLVREHSSIERATTQGGYGRRQVFELVQNGADALQGSRNGRIAIVLTDEALYCANEGAPIDMDGVDAILSSHLNVKKTNEIGRFGIGFKSVLAVTRYPEFYSRSGSFRFDHAAARQRISSAIGRDLGADEVPILRTAEAMVAPDFASQDPVLAELMTWATTVIKLPRDKGPAGWLSEDIARFPPEFLLFSAHVGLLTLEDRAASLSRRISLESTSRGLRLRADDRDEMWKVASSTYVPTAGVREDGGVHAERSTLPLVWAVQLQGRIGRGRFWAFFPTETITTLTGILNAPWKTNEDRQNLLPGPFNDEFIRTAAGLVADHLPRLLDPMDPARHLDLLPSRDSYNWADELLGQTLFDLISDRAVVPDQDGVPRDGASLLLHPEGVSASALRLWASYSGRPRNWAHMDVETINRRPRVERLIPPHNTRSHAHWLEALVADRTPAASASAIRVAAALVADAKPSIARELRGARIVLTDAGDLAGADRVVISVAGRGRQPGTESVAASLMSDTGTAAALRALGVREADPTTDLGAFLRAGVPDHDGWTTFWRLAARVAPQRLGDLVRDAGLDSGDLMVQTVAGTWEPINLALLPGRVVPGDGSRDGHVAVDTDMHADVLEHLRWLGVSDGPAPAMGRTDEAWLDWYRTWARQRYLVHVRRLKIATPREHLVSVEELRGGFRLTGPLDVLDVLSPEGKAALTLVALQDGSSLVEMNVSHESNPVKYGRLPIQGAVAWRLREAGALATSAGVRATRSAVSPVLFPLRSFLPVASCTEDEAVALGLPATPGEIGRDLWVAAAERAETCTDVRALGDLVVAQVVAGQRPTQIQARVGDGFESLPPDQVTVIADPTRAADLTAHGVPFILVGTEPEVEQVAQGLDLLRQAETVRFEVSSVLIRDATPLLDEFPPLRWYIDERWTELKLARCSELSERAMTASGTTEQDRSFIRTDTVVYWNQAGGDVELLRTLRRELDIPITDQDCVKIADRRSDQDRAKRLADLRAIGDPFERLAEAVGTAAIRSRLPVALLEALEQDRGGLTGRDLGAVAYSIMGANVLAEFRDDLVASGLEPPYQWSGSQSARAFVRGLGFPTSFAGTEPRRLDPLLDVDGPPDLPPLHEYQERVASAIHRMLEAGAGGRGLLSLPTGAGKTRIAVQALVEALREGTVSSPILWMAETEELCEQAVQAWAFVWRAVGSQDRLHISRLWSANEAEQSEHGHQVVVATVAKLQNCIDDAEYAWLASPGCVVVDEAHGAIAPVYTRLLGWLGLTHDQAPRPLIGLTATPYRGTSEEQTSRLVNRFYGNRLDHGALGDDQYATLQAMGVLATVEHELLDGAEIDLTPQELERLQQTRLIPTSAGARLGQDRARNDALLASLRRRGTDETVLLFAASVDHAEMLAAELTIEGIPAAAISSRTPAAARRHFIEEFRRGRIRVLTNYAVLTEGFDAPSVRAVYVARPTYSPNLYQQMIGRGLRGPLNGGKATCLIVNVRDNIAQYGADLAFTAFEYLWTQDGRETP